jgi:type II secretory pathway pseudopilin PulG
MTVLEIMIVLAIIGLLAYLGYSGFRVLSSQALTRDTLDLAAVMRRTQMLAMESATPVRLVIDLDQQAYWVEACLGDPTLTRPRRRPRPRPRPRPRRSRRPRAGWRRCRPASSRSSRPRTRPRWRWPWPAATSAARSATRSTSCRRSWPRSSARCGAFDSVGRELRRAINRDRGVKVREVWVQHLEESVTGGQVSISFFPMGWAEKAIITLGDGRTTYAIYLYGLTGRVEIIDGEPRNPDDHLLRNAKGEDEEER